MIRWTSKNLLVLQALTEVARIYRERGWESKSTWHVQIEVIMYHLGYDLPHAVMERKHRNVVNQLMFRFARKVAVLGLTIKSTGRGKHYNVFLIENDVMQTLIELYEGLKRRKGK